MTFAQSTEVKWNLVTDRDEFTHQIDVGKIGDVEIANR